MGLVTGGFSGLAIVIKAVTTGIIKGGMPLWATNLILNIPVFICSYIFIGKKFVGKTIIGASMLSVWLYIIPAVDLSNGDYLLCAIFGAICCGGGIGIVIKGHATTGGTDMVAALIQLKLKHYSVAKIMQILDAVIVIIGLFQFGLYKGMYAIIAIFVTTKVSDAIVEGVKYSKSAYIISDKSDEVAEKLMQEVNRGVTGINGMGMYTKEDKRLLYIVVSKREIVHVKEVVRKVDSKAFIIVSDVQEVLGEGFILEESNF